MTRTIWIAVVLACAAGCSLDLDRLREGAGIDGGGRDDAGERVDGGGDSDAGARDDAGEPDAGGCGCAGGGWQKTPFVVGGSGVSHVSVADLDVVASRRGGLASLLRMSVVGCGIEGLTTTPDEIEDTLPDTVVALVDWNGDGVLDLAAPDPGPGSLRSLTGNVSGGRYSLSWVVRGGEPSISAAASVFALDLGASDAAGAIALASDRAIVLLWREGIATAHELRTAGTGTNVAFGAMTTTGRFGAIAQGTAGVDLVLLDPDDDPPLTRSAVSLAYEAGMDIADVHFMDVDGDGDEDLVAVDVGREGYLLTYLRDGAGFEGASQIASAGAIAVTSGDVRGDSRPELITISETRSAVDIHEWTGTTWTTPESVSVSTPTSVAVGDVDADGQNDLVVGHAEGTTGQVTVVRRICM